MAKFTISRNRELHVKSREANNKLDDLQLGEPFLK